MKASEWNERYPVGTQVRYFPIRRKRNASVQELVKLLDDHKAGNVTDLVFVYRRRDGEKKEVVYHWFGEESTVMLLGLIEYMKGRIQDWIRKHP